MTKEVQWISPLPDCPSAPLGHPAAALLKPGESAKPSLQVPTLEPLTDELQLTPWAPGHAQLTLVDMAQRQLL